MSAMLAEKGFRYLGGANKPFFVSHARILEWGAEHGFTNIQITKRDDLPNRTLPFEMPTDDWDTVIAADHLGETETIELPGEAAWLFGGPLAGAAKPGDPIPLKAIPLTPSTKPVPAPAAPLTEIQQDVALVAGGVAIVGVLAAVGFLIWRNTRKPRPRRNPHVT